MVKVNRHGGEGAAPADIPDPVSPTALTPLLNPVFISVLSAVPAGIAKTHFGVVAPNVTPPALATSKRCKNAGNWLGLYT